MKTTHKIVIGTLVLLGSAASIGGFLYTRSIARAYDLGSIIVEPAEQNPKPEPAAKPVDSRIMHLKERGDGARLVAVAKAGELFRRLAFVDNGTLIVSATSTGEEGERQSIFVLSLDGGRALLSESDTFLATSSNRPSHLNVGTTCFSKENAKSVIDVWCREKGNLEEVHLTEHNGSEALTEPSISPGGDWVAFQVDDMSTRKKQGSTIWKIGMNRAGISQLTRGANDRYPAWSEDGKMIFFQRLSPSVSGGNWDIYRMNASGANPEPILRTHDEDEMWPTDAGEGRVIFSSGTSDEKMRLRILDIESKSGAWLTSGAYGSETNPSISPDGHLVSFLAPADPAEPGRLGIWVLELQE